MIDAATINHANMLKDNLQAQCVKGIKLYKTGAMRANIVNAQIGDNVVTIIAVPYASKTEEVSRDPGWIKRSIKETNHVLQDNVTSYVISGEEDSAKNVERGGKYYD